MSGTIEFFEQEYARIRDAASAAGMTPAEWVVAHLPPELRTSIEPRGAAAPKTMADLFAGRPGRFGSGNGEPRSDDVRDSVGEYLEAKHGAAHL